MTRRAFALVIVVGATILGAGPAAQSTPLSQASQTVKDDTWPPAGVLRMTQGVVAPRVIRETKPSYTADAMREQIQGVVEVEAIVLADGKVGEVRVIRSLDKEYGLDESAVEAVKGWEFRPGRTKDGQAVPVLVNIELTFSTRKR